MSNHEEIFAIYLLTNQQNVLGGYRFSPSLYSAASSSYRSIIHYVVHCFFIHNIHFDLYRDGIYRLMV